MTDRLRKALEYYANPEHWRTKNASSSLGNVGYGMGYHRTDPDGQMETLAAHCGHWVASKHMVHGGHWQADAGHVARQALRQVPAQVQVTEAMVERGHAALDPARQLYVSRDEVRAMLEAALRGDAS